MDEPTVFHQDNQGCIALIENNMVTRNCRHIEIKHHFIRHEHAEGRIKMIYTPTNEQVADILTKSTGHIQLELQRNSMGMRGLPRTAMETSEKLGSVETPMARGTQG
jgi:hypothetical protein